VRARVGRDARVGVVGRLVGRSAVMLVMTVAMLMLMLTVVAVAVMPPDLTTERLGDKNQSRNQRKQTNKAK
jgi:hypothetical protein